MFLQPARWLAVSKLLERCWYLVFFFKLDMHIQEYVWLHAFYIYQLHKAFGEVHLVGEVWYAYLIDENKSFWYNKDWWKFGLDSTRDNSHDKLYEVCILGTSSCRLMLNITICPLVCQFWDFVRSAWSIFLFLHVFSPFCRFEYNVKF